MTAGPPQPAGWYADPHGEGQRYWDGHHWTEHTSGVQSPAPAAAASVVGIEYDVEILRETLIGNKVKHSDLADRLNARARQGWRLKQAVAASVTGRVGPGGTEGLLLIFERERP